MDSCKLGVAIHGYCAEKSNFKSGLIPSELINLIRDRINIYKTFSTCCIPNANEKAKQKVRQKLGLL